MLLLEDTIKGLIEDAYSFCCSFWDEKASLNTVYEEDVEMYEPSAFDDDAEQERLEITIKRT